MKASQLTRGWIQDEINHQTRLIKKLEASGLNQLNGFNSVLSMRQEFLKIAKQKLSELAP